MAVLYITEFEAGADAGLQVAKWPALAHQTVSIGGAHTESAVFNGSTKLIRVEVDAICSIDIKTTPVATTSMCRMQAGDVEYHNVLPGDKLSVISNT